MASKYSRYSDAQLEKMAKENSSNWHKASSQGEKDALHQANVEINKILDSRKGTTSSFDKDTGKWSSSGGGSGSKSTASGGSKSSGSSGGSSPKTSTPGWLSGLGAGMAAGSGAGGLGTLLGGLTGAVLGGVGSRKDSVAGGTGSGGGYTPAKGYGVDDYGTPDYSVLLRDAMGAGATADEVKRLLDARTNKALGDSSLSKYAYDDTYAKAMQYINDNKTPEYDMSELMAQLNSVISQDQSSAPQYEQSEWDRTRDALAKAALEMSYDDWAKSGQYAALADRYGQQGEMSMRDVLGQVTSRTGGLASSYAQTAAQQQYNQYMSQLEEVARQMYSGERSDAIQNAQLAGEFSDSDYGRYLDQLAQYNKDRSFGFDVLSQVLSDSRYNQEWQNKLEQQAYQREQDAYADSMGWRSDAQNRVRDYLAMGGSLEQLYSQFPDLIATSGLNNAELEAMANAYRQEMAATASGGGSRSGGSGSGGAQRSGASVAGGTDWSSVEDWVSRYGDDAAADYIKEHYKQMGYSNQSTALSAWNNHQLERKAADMDESYRALADGLAQMKREGATAQEINEVLSEVLRSGLITQAERQELYAAYAGTGR